MKLKIKKLNSANNIDIEGDGIAREEAKKDIRSMLSAKIKEGVSKEDRLELLISVGQALLFCAVIGAFLWGVVLLPISEATKHIGKQLKIEDQENAMKQSIVAGVITDKRIESGKVIGNIFNNSYVPTTYRIYVANDYEFEGKTYTGEVYFEVNETIYNDYSIGEWFDSQSLNKE